VGVTAEQGRGVKQLPIVKDHQSARNYAVICMSYGHNQRQWARLGTENEVADAFAMAVMMGHAEMYDFWGWAQRMNKVKA
jgi:hypothetical protein